MSLRAAITALSSIAVTGVAHSYDLDAVPDSLHTAQLPALIPFLGDRSEDIVVGGFEGGSYEARYNVQHILFIDAVAQTRGLRDVLPSIAVFIDRYIAAMKTDAFLSGAISYAMSFRIVEPGIRQYPEGEGQPEFFSVAFDHQWRENL